MKLLQRPVSLEFAVPLGASDHAAVQSVEKAMLDLGTAVNKYQFNIGKNPPSILIEGNAAPSVMHKALVDALGGNVPVILRGQGSITTSEVTSKNSSLNPMAAVCIFESYEKAPRQLWAQHDNCGLARLVQLDSNNCLVDVSLHGWPASENVLCCENATRFEESAPTHVVEVHSYGDISKGSDSVGPLFLNNEAAVLGTVSVDPIRGTGNLIVESSHFTVNDLIGRSIVVRPVNKTGGRDTSRAGTDRIACGVIARSAGLFQNEKTVCSCSGKTLWAEAQDRPQR